MQPCNDSGFVVNAGRWGLSSFDWANGKNVWGNGSNYDPRAFPCEEMLVEQAALVKAVNPDAHVFVYRNMELALEWLESQRVIMNDPAKAHWFLQFTDGKGKKNGTIYNEFSNETGWPQRQYFFDFRVPEMVDYWVNVIVMGPTGTGAPVRGRG